MKKILLYGGLGFGVIILGVAGYLYYNMNMKPYHLTDKKVEKIVDSGFDIKAPNIPNNDKNSTTKKLNNQNASQEQQDSATNQNTASSDQAKTKGTPTETKPTNQKTSSHTNNDQSTTTNKGNTTDKTNTSDKSNTTDNSSQNDTQISSKQILASYKPSFSQLESQATTRLNQLLLSAYDEYKKKKANGDKVSFLYFYQKYKSSSDVLQSHVDQSFNQLYASLQQSLKKHGYSPSIAAPVKTEYSQQKSKMKHKILSKAISMISG